ncbi:MAG: DUF4338 domain-containing protein [Candidatus Rokubacteria bacterium]|nr:DUF4338 domain-containing protein [Candidatus Rokubacteria bacterium]
MSAPTRGTVVPLLTAEARLKRALRYHLHHLGFKRTPEGGLAPPDSSKDSYRQLHGAQLLERLKAERSFIARQCPRLRSFFAEGSEVDPSQVAPRLEMVEVETWQSNLFRLAALTWSVPVSQGYGRRMRFLVWDDSNGKLVGLLALGDPVFNLGVRDKHIGWTADDRRKRLAHVLDAYVLGALPPYNMLLGGKLVAALVGTREIRDAFAWKYAGVRGLISGEVKPAALAMVTTSSALGRSSVYNRLRLGNYRLFRSVGYTSGWGHFHIPDRLFATMRDYLKAHGHPYADNHRYGDGPNWKLRAVRECLRLLGLNTDWLHHGIEREVFVCELANNARSFLMGRSKHPRYGCLPTVAEVAAAARSRWLEPRAARRPEFAAWHREELGALLDVPGRVARDERGRAAAAR